MDKGVTYVTFVSVQTWRSRGSVYGFSAEMELWVPM